jgi:hypothetical protein
MPFTLDGQTIETDPVTMAELSDDSIVIVPGHLIEVGDWTDGELGSQAQVVSVLRTGVVPTVHVG